MLRVCCAVLCCQVAKYVRFGVSCTVAYSDGSQTPEGVFPTIYSPSEW